MTKDCIVCGKAYKYCPDCEPSASYKDIVDTPTCYAAWLTVIEYRDKIIDAEKAVSKFKGYGITKDKAEDYLDDVKKLILDAYAKGEVEEKSDDEPKIANKNKGFKK